MAKKNKRGRDDDRVDSAQNSTSGAASPSADAALAAGTTAPADGNPPVPPSSSEVAATAIAPAEHDKGMYRAAGIVGLMTILSRVLGLWRFRLMGQIFGGSGVADAFNFAFVFPNLTRRLFGEGALSSAFVPVFSSQLGTGKKEDANRTASILIVRLTYWLSLACIAVAAITAGARYLLPSIVTLDGDDILTLKLFIILLPYMVFINLSAVLMGVLNSLGHFTAPAFAPVLLNVFMILACKFSLPYFGEHAHQQIWAVAVAVLIGGIAQVLIQLPPLLARGFRFTPAVNVEDSGYTEVMNNFKPVVLLAGVFQLNVLMDNIFAKVFIPGDGAVTYLNMGTSIYQLPWSIFSLALGTAALPMLARFWAQNQKAQFRQTLLSALRMTIYLAVPCTIGIMLLSEDVVRLLYGTGRFLENDAEPVKRTASVVMFSSMGLIFFSLNAMLARALYAMKDMKTPTSTSAQSVVVNLALNIFFVLIAPLIAHKLYPNGATESTLSTLIVGLGNLREGGIALSSAISGGWQAWMLARVLRDKMGADAGEPLLPSDFVQTVGGTVLISAGLSMYGYRYFAKNPNYEGFIAFFASMVLALVPFWYAGRSYFIKQLSDKPKVEDTTQRFGVKDEHWSDELKFQFSIYSTIFASVMMGFLVWTIRDSLPPEGRSWPLIVQRAVLPVLGGIFAYSVSSGMILAREREELASAFSVKWRRRLGFK
jgi:putative peptidoglycan lipid II flippase